jgi:DNA-binding GntR family transcriptional regulator
VRLAETTGNAVLTRMLRGMVTRSSLISVLFGTSGTPHCEEHEHADILDALRDRDGDRAAALIRDHISHIEADLDLSAAERAEPDLLSVLGARQ